MQFKYRGNGGYNRQLSARNDQKYDYASSGGVFQKKKAIPAAKQFGNVWELNFSPMSRMAYSNSKKRVTEQNSNIYNAEKKKKKIKYKSGHVRRETRLKKAFEQMKNVDLSELDNNDKQKEGAINTPKSNNSQKRNTPKTNTPKTSKTKGSEMYSKYKKNRTFSKPNKSNKNVVEF